MTPYEGNKPYIFVSYAHKDTERVLPILETLSACGFRVWYDKGIEAGTEWSDTLAEHIEKASAVMIFLSEASLASHNCRQEIHYAVDLNSPMLVVYLDRVELAGGLRMRLGTTQAIFRYQHQYDDSFYGELLRAGVLKPCLETGEDTPIPDNGKTDGDSLIAPDKNKKKLQNDLSNQKTVDGLAPGLTRRTEKPDGMTMKTAEFTIEKGELLRCHSKSALIVVPEGVHTIGSEAFKNHENLKKVSLPDSITLIRSWAFACCPNLREFTLPEGIDLVSSHAFQASGLESITIPEGVRAIGREAFKGCVQLESVHFPSTLTKIGAEAFRGCTSLTEITLPASVETVGEYAFSGCTKLKKVYLSSSTVYSAETKKSFPAGAKLFYTDSSASVPVPKKEKKTVKTVTKTEHHFTIKNGVLTAYSGTGGAIVIPEGVEVIGEYAFGNCESITSVTVPEGVLEIAYNAFYYCNNLTSAVIAASVTTIGKTAFYFCDRLETVTLSQNTKYAKVFSPSFPKHTKLVKV